MMGSSANAKGSQYASQVVCSHEQTPMSALGRRANLPVIRSAWCRSLRLSSVCFRARLYGAVADMDRLSHSVPPKAQ